MISYKHIFSLNVSSEEMSIIIINNDSNNSNYLLLFLNVSVTVLSFYT